MIRYLIKNNFKIMFRNPVNILMFTLAPILVSAVLISAFSTLLNSYKDVEKFDVGYSVEADSKYAVALNALRQVGEDAGVTFHSYETGTPEDLIREHSLGGFITFTKDGYTIYETKDAEVEGAKLEYMIASVYDGAVSGDVSGIKVPVEEPEVDPDIDSTDYYGIVFPVYFAWCAIVCAAGLLTQEKKHRIPERYRISDLSSAKIYLGRVMPVIAVVTLCIGVAAVFSAVLLGVHWGNVLLSGLLLLLTVIAASSFGMMLYELTRSMIATVILSFGIVWWAGYIGGTFETYMFSTWPEQVKLLSPLYHTNRTLTELSNVGHSDYVMSAVIYLVIFSVVCSLVTIFAGSLRRKDRV
jgi:ABC-2 type transport system permease protein